MTLWFHRQLYLLDFTVAGLGRRKGRTLSLLAVYTLLVFLLASVMLLSQALRHEAAATLEHAPDVTIQRMLAGRHDLLPAADLLQLGRVRGVQSAEGRLWGYYYDPLTHANYTFLVPPRDSGLHLSPGRIILGPAVARLLRAAPHDPVVFAGESDRTFQVDAILPASSELASADLVLLSEDDFRAFFHYPAGAFTDLALSVANPQERRRVAAKVTARLPGTRAILRDDSLRAYAAVFNWREGLLLLLLAGPLLAFAIFALEKASGLSAAERREIGILKALGWETSDILRMKFYEGFLLSSTAFLSGYLLAYLHIFRFSSALLLPVLRGWSALYPRLTPAPRVDGLELATLLLLTVLPYALATAVPAWRAATLDPDAVMRGGA